MDDSVKPRLDYAFEYYGYPILDECANYSISGIISFLQSEWNKIEIKSVQWEVERTELQAKIAYLQGERRSQENLKNDLIRRIKMLEYALKQERKKQDINLDKPRETIDYSVINEDKDNLESEFNESDIYLELSKNNQKINDENTKWKDEKLRLKKIFLECRDNNDIKKLTECENGDNDIDLQKNKVETCSDQKSSTSFIDGTFKFLSNEGDLFKNEHDKNDESLHDSETEKALNEFDNLVKNLQHKSKGLLNDDDNEWSKVDQKAISKMKELYIQERGPGSKSVNKSFDKLSASNNNGELIIYDELVDGDMSDSNSSISSVKSISSDSSGSILSVISKKPLNKTQGNNNNLSLGELAGLTNDTGLIIADLDQSLTTNSNDLIKTSSTTNSKTGLLSNVSSTNSASISSVQTNTTATSSDSSLLKKSWSPRFTMRSHFDGIRSVLFHPNHPLLITASEDHTLKLWNLTKTIPSKKGSSHLDVEPIYSYRGHTSPILCSCMDETTLYSGSLDGEIRIWKIPVSTMDPYDAFDNSLHILNTLKHDDAVWSLCLLKNKRLASISADCSLKIWNLENLLKTTENDEETEMNDIILENSHTLSSFTSTARPSCSAIINFNSSEVFSLENYCCILIGFTDGLAGIVNVNTGLFVSKFNLPANNDSNTENDSTNISVYTVVSNCNKPHCLVGYEDGRIRCFDSLSCEIIFSILAHQDSVSSLAIDQHGTFLLSGSHDGQVRVWNLSNRSCLQEISCHRKKRSESVHCVVFHPTKNLFATAGADALAKVFI